MKIQICAVIAIMILYGNMNVVKSESYIDCMEYNQMEYETHNKKVLSDILSSFKLDLTGYKELPFWETQSKIRLGISRREANTFGDLFRGASIGNRRLYIKSQDNMTTGYLLYKQLNGTNVVKKVVKEKDSWKVIETNKKKAKQFYASFHKCEKDS